MQGDSGLTFSLNDSPAVTRKRDICLKAIGVSVFRVRETSLEWILNRLLKLEHVRLWGNMKYLMMTAKCFYFNIFFPIKNKWANSHCFNKSKPLYPLYGPITTIFFQIQKMSTMLPLLMEKSETKYHDCSAWDSSTVCTTLFNLLGALKETLGDHQISWKCILRRPRMF